MNPAEAAMPRFRDTFCAVTGNAPYPYQEQLADLLFAGESVVFRAPTGAGKTWAVTVPFLHSIQLGARFADRLIYSLPLRSLATSLHQSVFRGIEGSGMFGSAIRTGKDRDYSETRLHCSLQIGGQKNDPFFESDLVFTTIDQALSGYLMMPLSLPPKLDNIVAGALLGSFLVFDEAHLLDSGRAFSTMVEMLSRFSGLCRFAIMTATMSDDGIRELAKQTGAKPLFFSKNEIAELPSQKSKRRSWTVCDQALDSNSILAVHNDGRSLVIVNTVTRAQRLFRELKARCTGSSIKLLLLHSRFRPEDRARTEAALERWFGPNASETNVILISTQVIEAGIDISADVLHTELSPMNALIQRAGRCARYPHRPIGEVIVYLQTPRRPYEVSELARTRSVLDAKPPSGPVDFDQEQQWVNSAHGEEERRVLRQLENILPKRHEINSAMEDGDRGILPKLVRDIDSVNILISSSPEQVFFDGRDGNGNRIGWPELISVPRTVLWTIAASVDQARTQGAQAGQWIAKRMEEPEGDDARQPVSWAPILRGEELQGQWLLAIHPNHALYDPEIGLVLGEAGIEVAVRYTEVQQRVRYQYSYESWVAHAIRVQGETAKICAVSPTALEMLSRSLGAEAGLIEDLAQKVGLLHDAGKLAVGWQEAAWTWQRLKDQQTGLKDRRWEPVAHTDWSPAVDGKSRTREHVLPNHAAEGAAIAAVYLDRTYQELGWCGLTAIVRHHSARAKGENLSRYRLPVDIGVYLAQVGLNDFGLVTPLPEDELSDRLISLRKEDDQNLWPLYLFLVRVLRLADQGSLRS